jgi:uncharacterized cupin superfamily protein
MRAQPMADRDVNYTKLDPGEQPFQLLRRELGVESFGLNLITLRPRQRGRIHRHERQEEVYLVLEGELTLALEDEERTLEQGDLARVGPAVRRQLLNHSAAPVMLLAIGGSGEHARRDGRAWSSWDEDGEGRPPQEVPQPEDLPAP